MDNLRITAHLSSPFIASGFLEMPFDSILAFARIQQLKYYRHDDKKGRIFDKNLGKKDIPEDLDLPLDRFGDGDDWVYAASFAIHDAKCIRDAELFWAKHFPFEYADLLTEKEGGRKINVASGTLKSYKMPLMPYLTDKIRWFVRGEMEAIRRLLWHVNGIGKKNAYGFGFVCRWDIEKQAEDYSVIAKIGEQSILMRNVVSLPDNVTESRKGYYGIRPPYWHPYWKRECYMPC